MAIIDRYLLRVFFKVLLVSFLSLTGLYVMVDTAGNLTEFLSAGKQQGSTLIVLLDYYGPRILQFYDRTSGILSLIAAMFTLAWLQRTNEITAIIAGGISKARIVRPLILATAGVSVLGVVNREWMIPQVRHKLIYNAQNMRGENARPLTPCYDNQTDVFLDGRSTVGLEQRIDEPKFNLPSGLSAIGSRLIAKRAFYREPEADRPGGYLLEDIESPAQFAQMSNGVLNESPVVLTPRDTPWLKPNQGFVVSGVTFEQLAAGSMWQELSSTRDLVEGLRAASLDFGAGTRVRVHARLVQPLLDFTLFFLGLPLVFGRDNRNIFLAIGVCAVVVGAFLIVTMACHSLGSLYLLSPSLAAWLPLIVFAPIAAGFAGRIWE